MTKSALLLASLVLLSLAAPSGAAEAPPNEKTPTALPNKKIKLKDGRTVIGFSPSGRLAAVVDKDQHVAIIELAGERDILTTTGRGAQFAPDEQKAFVLETDFSTVKAFSIASGKQESNIANQRFPILIPPDGKTLISDYEPFDGHGSEIDICDAATGKKLFILPYSGHGDAVMALSLSDDGTRLAASMQIFVGTVAFGIEPVNVWDLPSKKLLLSIQPHVTESCGHVDAISLSHDGKLLATSGCDGAFRIWDVESGKKVFEREQATFGLFSYDDTLLAFSRPKEIRLLDWRQDKYVLTLDDNAAETWTPSVVAYSKDGKTLLAGGTDGFIRIWTLPVVQPQTPKK